MRHDEEEILEVAAETRVKRYSERYRRSRRRRILLERLQNVINTRRTAVQQLKLISANQV